MRKFSNEMKKYTFVVEDIPGGTQNDPTFYFVLKTFILTDIQIIKIQCVPFEPGDYVQRITSLI